MEFLKRRFGRDIFNLISDYYSPITELARRRKQYVNKVFNICLNYIQHTTFSDMYYAKHGWRALSHFSGNDRWNMRYNWIKRLRSSDIYLNNGNTLKLRNRNQDIPEKVIHDLYDIYCGGYNGTVYLHEYHKESSFEFNKMLNYVIEIPTL